MKQFGVKIRTDLFTRYRKGFIIWALCLVLFVMATILSWFCRQDLYDQQAAARWSEDDDYAQLSCFYPVTEQPTDYDFQSLHHSVEQALKNASMQSETEGAKLFIDAYSMTGSLTLSTDNADMEVKAVGVTEDFFLFHPVSLLEGSYFDENMLMLDGIILDEDAAFTLYGSNNVVGMPVFIGNAQYYIRGVVKRDEGYFSGKAGLDSSLCYVPAETLLERGLVEGSYTYEVLMPNPVEGFAKGILETALNDIEGRLEVVENSARFLPEARKEILLDYAVRSMSSKGIIYPYWENVARAMEDIVAAFYALQMITFVITAGLTIWYAWYRFKNRTWNLKMLWEKGQDFLEKRKKSRGLGILILLSLCLNSGCGTDEVTSAAVQSKDYVYSFESVDEKIQGIDFSQAFYVNERLIVTSYRYEEVPMEQEIFNEEPMEEAIEVEEMAVDAAAVTEEVMMEEPIADELYMEDMYFEEMTQNTYFKVMQLDLEGNLLTEFEILIPQDAGIHNVCADEAGNLYMLLCEYGKDMSSPEYVKDLFSLLAYSETGEELFRVQLGTGLEPDEWYYANELVCDKTQVYLSSSKGLEIYGADGSLIKTIESEEIQNGNLYMLRDGSPAFLIHGNRGMYMKTWNVESGEFSSRIEFPFNAYEYNFYPGSSTDLLLASNTGVFSYNFEEEGMQKVLDFVDSDMLCNNLHSLMEVEEKRFFGSYYDNELNVTKFGFFNKVDPSTIKEKKVLTLACYWLDDDMRRRVVEYNKMSEEYRIRIEDYYRYNTSDDYSIGLSKMNTDIVSGKTPDIIVLSSDMPVDSYISKGLFEDMLPFLEKDPELKKEDYSAHIIDLFSYNGKWYQMVPSYSLYSLFGKAAEVGKEPGWTLEDLQQLRSKKGEDVAVFSEMTQYGLLSYSLLFAENQFINWETGECSFDSQEFIELLEFINEFPKEINYQELYDDPDYWEQQETVFRDGKALLMPYALSGFEDFLYCEEGSFGEEVTAIGFPVKEGVGSVIMSNANYAISAKSPYKQEAWEFLRYYLTEEYQTTIRYGWPLLDSAMDKLVEEACQPPYYTDEFGNKVEYEETYYINGVEIVLEPLTQQDCERVLSFIDSAEHTYSYDTAIMNIVAEEAAPFFEGEKTAAEAADIIQSRIFIYVNENK